MSMRIVSHTLTIFIYDGELILMILNDTGINEWKQLCFSIILPILCISQDLMKQGKDGPIINLHFKQYKPSNIQIFSNILQACICQSRWNFCKLQICQKSSIKSRLNKCSPVSRSYFMGHTLILKFVLEEFTSNYYFATVQNKKRYKRIEPELNRA